MRPQLLFLASVGLNLPRLYRGVVATSFTTPASLPLLSSLLTKLQRDKPYVFLMLLEVLDSFSKLFLPLLISEACEVNLLVNLRLVVCVFSRLVNVNDTTQVLVKAL